MMTSVDAPVKRPRSTPEGSPNHINLFTRRGKSLIHEDQLIFEEAVGSTGNVDHKFSWNDTSPAGNHSDHSSNSFLEHSSNNLHTVAYFEHPNT